MPKVYTVRKPTHLWRGPDGAILAVGQLRGDFLMLNLLNPHGEVVAREWAVGSCTFDLTGYGYGVTGDNPDAVRVMLRGWRSRWAHLAVDVPEPATCERT